MKVQIKGRVLDVSKGKDSTYVTMNDTEIGGSCKVGFPGDVDIKIDQLIDLSAEVKPGIGKYGLYLTTLKILGKEDK